MSHNAGIAAVMRYAETARQKQPPPSARQARATTAQRGLWLTEQLAEGRNGYTVTHAYQIIGPLDERAFRQAVEDVWERHETLRLRFQMRGDELWQVAGTARADFSYSDCRALQLNRPLAEFVTDRLPEPLDMEHGPLARVELIRLADAEHALLLHLQHAINDAASAAVLEADLRACYAARMAGRAPELPAAAQFLDHAAELEGRLAAQRPRALRFWAAELAGANLTTLPYDGPDTDRASFRAYWSAVDFDGGWRAVRQLAAQRGSSPFAVLAAATAAACMLETGSGDLIVGTTISARPAEFDTTVGPFVNTVPIRVRATPDATADDLLQAGASALARALEQHEVPFDDLVPGIWPELPAGKPPITVTLTANTVLDTDLALPGTTCRRIEHDSAYCQRPLAVYLTGGEDGRRLRACASSGHYQSATVDRLLASIRRVCEQLAADPSAPLTALGWVPGGQASAGTAGTTAPAGQTLETDRCLATVRSTWAEVLGTPESQLHEDFFESGGGSLAAMRLAVRLGLSIKQVFTLRTQTAMATEVSRRNRP